MLAIKNARLNFAARQLASVGRLSCLRLSTAGLHLSANRDKPYYVTTPIFYPNAGKYVHWLLDCTENNCWRV